MKIRSLSNDALVESLKHAVMREREATADVVEHLAEVGRRKLYLDAACSNMTAYCHERLGYTKDAAHTRVTAAYLSLDYPPVLGMLRSGELNLTAIRTLSPALAPGNYEERLRAAVGRSKLEIEDMVAAWRGLPPPDYVIELALDRDERALLMHARDITRHMIPDGDIKKVIMRAVRDLVENVEARKFGKLRKPQTQAKSSVPTETRAPNRATRREVSERDGQRCCYVSKDGHRCSSTAWIEFDHRDGWANTQRTDVPSTRLLCRAHNQGREKGHDDQARA